MVEHFVKNVMNQLKHMESNLLLQKQRKFNFVDTTATEKVFALSKRIRAVRGGTSASKTISILIWLIDYCQTKQNRAKLCSVVSESHPHLERGAILDFQNIMKDRGYWNESLWNQTKHTYTFETGNKLEFYSVDTFAKAHGPRRDVLFVNEANHLDYKIIDQLITRTREIVWLDWNPTEEFWFDTEMLPNRKDIDFITLTYLDNEALDKITISEIESHKNDKNWWRVYALGQIGAIESRIYKNWDIITYDEVPHEAKLRRYYLDFGYTNDPTAIGAIYEYNGGLIIDEIAHKTRMLNKDIIDVFEGLELCRVVADSSEPKSIAEIKEAEILIVPAQKGPGSTLRGIGAVQQQKISVTRTSVNIIREYRNYVFVTDANGKITNEPIDINNHQMDGIRYGIADLKNPNQEKATQKQKQQMQINKGRSVLNSTE